MHRASARWGKELLVICDWLLGKNKKKPLLQGSVGILPASSIPGRATRPCGADSYGAERDKERLGG
jgi:hypothetical protein